MLQRSLMSTRMNVDALSITPTRMNLKSVSYLLSCSLLQPNLNISESALHHCMYIYLNPHSVLILLHVRARRHARFNSGLSCLTHLDYLFRFFLLPLLRNEFLRHSIHLNCFTNTYPTCEYTFLPPFLSLKKYLAFGGERLSAAYSPF